ncbi:MAG: VCBS repeat-containing protein [Myxococcales bacterium]|nr:VCBS repeat-containing protein [Myxococcales bacterium]
MSIPRDGFVAAVDGTVPAGGGSRRPLLVYIETQGNFAVLRDLVTTGNPELARCDTGAPVGLVRRVPLAISTTNSGDLIAIGIERPVDPGVCVFAPGSPVLPADPGWIPRFHRLATGARFDLELVPLVWANTDGDACPELVAPVLTGPGAGTPGQNLFDNTAATCTFATASALVPTWALNGAKVLGAGNLDRVGADELVTSKNVVRIDSLAAAVPLGQAVGMDRLKVADFNGDGIVDIAGTDTTTAGAGEASREAVRILRTSGPPGTWQASTVVVETLRPVLQLVVGDFDGDRIADLALTEVMALDQNRVPLTMAVSVIYGQRSEIPSYQVVLETDAVVIAALGLRRGGQHDEDGVDDLGVAKITAGGSAKLAASVLYGSAQRSLTAPLTVGAGVPVAALTAGAWAGADLLKDLVVYAGNFQYVWPQQTGGNFVITGTGTSTPVEPAGLRDFAITPAMTAGGTSTIVSFSAATQKVAVGGIGACPGSWTGSGTQGVGTRPTLQARNLDGNPGDELLLTSLEGTGIQPVQIFPAIGGECKMGAGLLPLVHPLATCDAAVGIEAGTLASDDPKRREVLAVCRRAGGSVLSRFDVAPGGETVGTALDVKLTGRAKRLMVGDFTGDGLEDAVAITSVGSVDFATLLVQCSTTDASCDQ